MPYFFFLLLPPKCGQRRRSASISFPPFISSAHAHLWRPAGGGRVEDWGWVGRGGGFIGSFICKFPLILPSLIRSLSLIFFVAVKCPECVEVSPFPRLWRSQLATCEAHKTNHLKDSRMALPTGEVMTRLRARQWRKLTIVTINMIINNTQQRDWCEVTVAKALAEDLMMLLSNG